MKSGSNINIPECLKTLAAAQEVYWDTHVTSENTKLSVVFGAYKSACKLGIDPRGAELDWLMENGSAAAKVFCCFVAWELQHSAGLERFETLLGDETVLKYRSGCFGFPTTLNEIARQFLENHKFHDFPSSA